MTSPGHFSLGLSCAAWALKRALSFYGNYEIWHKIQLNAVQSDFSWKRSAKEYEALYKRLTAK